MASVDHFLCRKANSQILQTCIKLLKQYLSLPHGNGSSETGASLSLEAAGRSQDTPLVKAVESLSQIRQKTRKWVVIQTSGPDEEKPFAYISLFFLLLCNIVALGQLDTNEILYFLCSLLQK